VNYFNRVLTGNGGVKHVDDFARLFMAPGVAHCGGGAGPNPVGTFEAVVNWVENGVAPERLMASRALPGGAVRTRPLCAYPKTANWTGAGSSDAAANFVCVDGQHDAADFKVTGPGSN
jgi:feruloyl esterase